MPLQRNQRNIEIHILVSDLKTCSANQDLERGKQVHAEAIECGHDSNIYVASALVNMYSKCGSMLEARQVFDSIELLDVVPWTALILGYAENGQGFTALHMFGGMKNGTVAPDSVTFVAAFKACASITLKGRQCRGRVRAIHNLALEQGCSTDIYVQSTLVDAYGKCGCMVDARQVFNCIRHPNVVSWNVLIVGYADNGQGFMALDLFSKMQTSGPAPSPITFVAALKACSNIAMNDSVECITRGRKIHKLVVENGCDSNVYVRSTLIDMYAKCGSMLAARQVFDSMKHPDVVSWTSLILGYADNGEGLTGLDLFVTMRTDGPAPNMVTFVAVLKTCSCLAMKEKACARDWGKAIHNLTLENNFNLDTFVQNTLIDMYSNCGIMQDAHQVFDSMNDPDLVSWNALILGYADNGQGLTALELFTRMKTDGPAPDSITFSGTLMACACLGALEFGKTIHSEIDDLNNVVLVNSLVDFYSKCGSILEAKSIFDMHSEARDIGTWTALLAGFSNCGDNESVFTLFEEMQEAGFKPDGIALLYFLTCCSHAGLVDKGKECFDAMPSKYGMNPTLEHHTQMLDIFGRANKFDDAMALLRQMCWSPDDITWNTILGACQKWKNVEIGRLAFESLMHFNKKDAAAYVVMGQIYKSRGMLQEQEMVMGMKNKQQFE